MIDIRNNIKVATGLRSCYIYYSKEVEIIEDKI